MKMPARLLLLTALVLGSQLQCREGEKVQVQLLVVPSSGFLWEHQEGVQPLNGPRGEYRSLQKGSGQVFQFICPAKETETSFSLRAPWSPVPHQLQTFRLATIEGPKFEP